LKCKVIYDKDGILDISFSTYKPRVIKSLKVIINNDIQYKYKALNRNDIDNLYKKRDSCDDIIIVKNGLVTDTSIANIAILVDNIWLTPKTPLLYGTSRAKLIDECFLKESDISIEQLADADKIALMNAMISFKILSNNYKLIS